jgi:hypothetical protein
MRIAVQELECVPGAFIEVAQKPQHTVVPAGELDHQTCVFACNLTCAYQMMKQQPQRESKTHPSMLWCCSWADARKPSSLLSASLPAKLVSSDMSFPPYRLKIIAFNQAKRSRF